MGGNFHIYLPASQESPAADSRRHKKARAFGRVLSMDDEESVGDYASDCLRGLGCSIDYAANGEEAIRLFKAARESSAPFNVVIFDLTVRDGLGGRLRCRK